VTQSATDYFKGNIEMNFSIKYTFGVLFIALAMTAPIAQANDGWYVNLSGGGSFTAASEVDVPAIAPIVGETTQELGPVLLGAIGKEFPSGFRIEGEVSYRDNEFDDIKATGTATISGVTLTGNNVPIELGGEFSSLGFMANIAYDFMKGEKLHPFVLAGIGFAQISVDDAIASSNFLADDNDLVFAYQVGAGIKYDVFEKVDLGISYRLFSTSDPEFTGSDGTTDFSMEYLNHTMLVGLTFSL
jgi:opacity protein-like surface antigen